MSGRLDPPNDVVLSASRFVLDSLRSLDSAFEARVKIALCRCCGIGCEPFAHTVFEAQTISRKGMLNCCDTLNDAPISQKSIIHEPKSVKMKGKRTSIQYQLNKLVRSSSRHDLSKSTTTKVVREPY